MTSATTGECASSQVLPSRVAGLLGVVRGAVDGLGEGAPGGEAGRWPREEREAAIGTLDGLVRDLTLYRGLVLRAHERAGAWGSVSDRDFADYRSRTTGVGRGAAVEEQQLAQGLEELPALAAAVQDGALSLEHARTFTRWHRGVSPQVRDALGTGGLDDLLAKAKARCLSAPELGRAARAWAAQVDAAAAQRDFDQAHRRRSLVLRKHAGGVVGEFFLDPLAGDLSSVIRLVPEIFRSSGRR